LIDPPDLSRVADTSFASCIVLAAPQEVSTYRLQQARLATSLDWTAILRPIAARLKLAVAATVTGGSGDERVDFRSGKLSASSKLYLRGEGMQILPETPGDTSGETSSESSPSPHTPLNAGAHFMHAAMNQRRSAFLANPGAIPFSSFTHLDPFKRIAPLVLVEGQSVHCEIMFSLALPAIYLLPFQSTCSAKFHASHSPEAAALCVTVVALHTQSIRSFPDLFFCPLLWHEIYKM
jgi:hypothetical protein